MAKKLNVNYGQKKEQQTQPLPGIQEQIPARLQMKMFREEYFKDLPDQSIKTIEELEERINAFLTKFQMLGTPMMSTATDTDGSWRTTVCLLYARPLSEIDAEKAKKEADKIERETKRKEMDKK